MRIKGLKIQKAGDIEKKEMTLSEGINVLAANQKCRVDLYQFLDTMFFGKEKAIEYQGEDAAPQEESADCQGILWFEKGKESFRLTRDFISKRQYHELLSETTGALTDAGKGSLEKVMYPISRHIFENSGFVQGFRSQNQRDQARELQMCFSGYEGAGDSAMDLGRTVQLLKMSRKGYQDQEERRVRQLQKEQTNIQNKEMRVRDEVEQLRTLRIEQKEREEQLLAGKESEDGTESLVAELNRKARIFTILLSVLTIIVIGFAILGPFPATLRLLLVVAAGFFVLSGYLNRRAKEQELSQIRRTQGRRKVRREQHNEERQKLENEFEEKARQYLNLHGIVQEYKECQNEPTPEKTEIMAINLAMETLQELSDNIFVQMNQPLEKRISQILREVTDGNIRRLRMDENLHIEVMAEGARRLPLEKLDQETLAWIHMALRLAAGEVLGMGESFPVIFEGFFERYSDEFCKKVLHFLSGEQRQFLIGGEASRVLRLLEEEKLPHQILQFS